MTSPTVADVDEARIVEILTGQYPRPQAAELGVGDDAAVLPPSPTRSVVTVDTLVQGQDYHDVWPCGYVTTGEDVGWKSAAQNLSDINAMGAVAHSGLVTLSLPPHTPLSWVEDYARGVCRAARELGAAEFGIVGGDLSAATELQLGMTVIGRTSRPVTRSGARVGDRLLLSGATPGRADAGLSLLLSEAEADAVGQWDGRDAAVAAAQFRSRPPLGRGRAARETLTSLMDVSDGLVRDADRLARASGVGLELDEAALAREAHELQDWAGRHAGDALRRVLYGGEDFLLLGTSPVGTDVPEGYRQIGTVVDGAGIRLAGSRLAAESGFDHFR